jgi:ABC-type iron transport system FetAB permease component
LLVAALRIVAQLLLIALVLKGFFALTSPLWTSVAVLIIIMFAGWKALAR